MIAHIGMRNDSAVGFHKATIHNIAYQLKLMDHKTAFIQLGGPIALLKAHTSRVLEYCAREAQQIFGGLGYTRGGQGAKVERLAREVRAYAVPAGSEEIMFDLAVRVRAVVCGSRALCFGVEFTNSRW